MKVIFNRLMAAIACFALVSCGPNNEGSGGLEVETVPYGVDRILDGELALDVRQVTRDYPHVQYHVKDGVVTLLGAATEQEQQEIGQRLASVHKKDLVNRLQIVPGAVMAADSMRRRPDSTLRPVDTRHLPPTAPAANEPAAGE